MLNKNEDKGVAYGAVKADAKNARDYNVMIVMRHSKRIDQHPNFAPNLKWNEKDEFERPYDPPICDFNLPIDKFKEVQSAIPSINIKKIIVSPFLRCIQTAAIIGKYINIKSYEIDARLGENGPAINRCILHTKKKENTNNYKIPNDYKDVVYLSLEEIKKIILGLYNGNKDKDKDKNDEEKKENKNVLNEEDLTIEWKHKEKAGNHLHIECTEERRKKLNQQQDKDDKQNEDILMVTHGDCVSQISDDLCGKILIVDECGWICLTQNGNSIKPYSPTTIQILLDKNAT